MKTGLTLLLSILFLLAPICGTTHIYAQEKEFIPTASQKGIRTSSDVFAIALPAVAAATSLWHKDWVGVGQLALSGVTAMGTTLLLKYTISKQRPDNSDFHSFPSGHTACGFVSAAYLQRRYGWTIGGPAFALATYVGWARIYSRRHDFWDVLAGAAVGTASAYIYTHPFVKNHDISISPGTDGKNFIISAQITF